MKGQAEGVSWAKLFYLWSIFQSLRKPCPHNCLSAMILRFPKSDSRDVLNCPQLLLRTRWTNRFRSWFDKLTTNEINKLPFILSLSKDLISASLTNQKYLLSTSFLLPLKCQVFLQFCMNDPCVVD